MTQRRVPTTQLIPMVVEIPQEQFVAFDSEVQLTMALPQVQHSEKIIVCVSFCDT